MTKNISPKVLLGSIYLASLLYSFSYALPLYINSSFLSHFLATEKLIGIIFTLGALLSLVGVLVRPFILKRIGNYRATLTFIALEVLALMVLALSTNPFYVVGAFIVNQLLTNVIYLNLNTFLDASSRTASMGSTRGIFLTLANGAILVAPLFASLLLVSDTFTKIYLASSFFMACLFFTVYHTLHTFKDPPYKNFSLPETLRTIKKNHNLHAIIAVQFVLNFFYAWIVIYTPLYLHEYLNIPIETFLGIIMPITLLPFVIFQIILGKLADTRFGEKEILIGGIVIMAISTSALSFITTASILVWALALFATRVGASAMEIMAESYFYKQVKPQDVHIVTFLYVVRMVAYLAAPILGSLALHVVEYRYMFLILGIFTLVAIPPSLHFKDSK